MISGVTTCGNSSGYCLLGIDCTTDDDFLPDPSGHCDGLKRAFTPTAPFSCCKFNDKPLVSRTPVLDFDVQKVTSAEIYDKAIRKTRENIDYTKIDNEQLAKLNQIESVVKKIVEQLINETANNLKTNNTITDDIVKIEEPVMKNEAKNETPMTVETSKTKDTTETIETGLDAKETLDDGEFKTEISENKEETEPNKIDAIDPKTEESAIDDEFKAEKNICQKSCKSEIIFMVEKKPICYGTLLDDIWILTSATCASR